MVPIVVLFFILNDGWPWENLCATDLAQHYIECLKDPRHTQARPPAPQVAFGPDESDDLRTILRDWNSGDEPPRVDRSKVLLRHQTQVFYDNASMTLKLGWLWTCFVLMIYTRLKEIFFGWRDAKE